MGEGLEHQKKGREGSTRRLQGFRAPEVVKYLVVVNHRDNDLESCINMFRYII